MDTDTGHGNHPTEATEHTHIHDWVGGRRRLKHTHRPPETEEAAAGLRAHGHPNGRHAHPHGHEGYQ